MQVNFKDVNIAINKLKPVQLSSHELSPMAIEKIEKVLSLYLAKLKQEDLQFQLSFCIKELIENAKKANLKRVYFDKKNWDLTNHTQYKDGMSSFKSDVYGNLPEYHEYLKEANLYVKLVFHLTEDVFSISIRNNSMITEEEELRISERLKRSAAFDSMDEAFRTVLDDTEGAGLGIVTLMLMLKKMGANTESFSITGCDGETVAEIQLPRERVQSGDLSDLVNKVVDEIQSVPKLPDHVMILREKMENPNSTMEEIANLILRDPALTTELLKLVNSAQFSLQGKVTSIDAALKLVGMAGLENILLTYGSQKIIEDKFGQMKQLWDHCYKAAFFGTYLARKLNGETLVDDVHVACLLHDLGRVIIDFLHPEYLEKIEGFCIDRNISSELFEQFTIGMHHAKIGALITEKWHFPEKLTKSIFYHHEPEKAEPENRRLVDIVYLAEIFVTFQEDRMSLGQMNKDTLRKYGLAEDEAFMGLLNELESEYKKHLG